MCIIQDFGAWSILMSEGQHAPAAYNVCQNTCSQFFFSFLFFLFYVSLHTGVILTQVNLKWHMSRCCQSVSLCPCPFSPVLTHIRYIITFTSWTHTSPGLAHPLTKHLTAALVYISPSVDMNFCIPSPVKLGYHLRKYVPCQSSNSTKVKYWSF